MKRTSPPLALSIVVEQVLCPQTPPPVPPLPPPSSPKLVLMTLEWTWPVPVRGTEIQSMRLTELNVLDNKIYYTMHLCISVRTQISVFTFNYTEWNRCAGIRGTD